MPQKRANPPGATGGLEGFCDNRRAAKFHSLEIAQDRPESHTHRARWLARRFRLSLAMAEAIADLHFDGGRRA
jgi:hypothetical protein